MFRLLTVLYVLGLAVGCSPSHSSQGEVVVYASQDQVYAEPILQQFTAETGITVKTVFDGEAVKTVGLANRLLAEASRPEADIFWNNEMLRTLQLSSAGVLEPGTHRVVFGSRSRRIVIHRDRVPASARPSDWLELTNSRWRGKVALAYPLFGTTATHFLHWRRRWGEKAWKDWCHALMANQPLLMEGNSAVVQIVGRGEAWIGMTDSDDIVAGKRNGLPIEALPESANGLRIPNSASMVKGAKHPESARALLEYLSRPSVIEELVARGALEHGGMEGAESGKTDWEGLVGTLKEGTEEVKSIFVR